MDPLKTPEDVAARLNIPTDEEQAKKELEAAQDGRQGTKDPEADDPRGEEQYSFTVDYVDARGKRWKGDFTSKILTLRERSMVGAYRARLSAGVPAGTLDALTDEINYMLSHMLFSLTGERPKWAEELAGLQDPGIVQAIFTEVTSHEDFFLGWGSPEETGKAKP